VIAIAKRFGIGVSTVHRHVRRHGWSRKDVSDLPVLELAQLRVLAGKLRERLEALIDDGSYIQGGKTTGSQENPANLLLKLCQITKKSPTWKAAWPGRMCPRLRG